MLKNVPVDEKILKVAEQKGPRGNAAIPASLLHVSYKAQVNKPGKEKRRTKRAEAKKKTVKHMAARKLYFESLVQNGLLSPLTPGATPMSPEGSAPYETLRFKKGSPGGKSPAVSFSSFSGGF